MASRERALSAESAASASSAKKRKLNNSKKLQEDLLSLHRGLVQVADSVTDGISKLVEASERLAEAARAVAKWSSVALHESGFEPEDNRSYKDTSSAGKEAARRDKGPKRPLTAYIIFSKERMKEIPVNHEQKSTDRTKQIGQEWREMSDVDKKPYVDQAAGLKKVYEAELAKFKSDQADEKPDDRTPPEATPTQSAGATDGKKKSKPRMSVEEKEAAHRAKGPKRPPAPYTVFIQRRMVELRDRPDLKQTERMKQVAHEWREMSDADKQPYADQAARCKEAYGEELAKFKAGDASWTDPPYDDALPAEDSNTGAPPGDAGSPLAVPADSPSESRSERKRRKKEKKERKKRDSTDSARSEKKKRKKEMKKRKHSAETAEENS